MTVTTNHPVIRPATKRAAEALRAYLFDNDAYNDFMGDLVHTLPHVDIDWNGDEEVAAQTLADAENEILDAFAYALINNTFIDNNNEETKP